MHSDDMFAPVGFLRILRCHAQSKETEKTDTKAQTRAQTETDADTKNTEAEKDTKMGRHTNSEKDTNSENDVEAEKDSESESYTKSVSSSAPPCLAGELDTRIAFGQSRTRLWHSSADALSLSGLQEGKHLGLTEERQSHDTDTGAEVVVQSAGLAGESVETQTREAMSAFKGEKTTNERYTTGK